MAIRDGRYEVGNHELYIDLRIDEAISGVISADLFRQSRSGPQYVASVRTVPGRRISLADGNWAIVGQDELGAQTSGRLMLRAGDDDGTVAGSLVLDGPLNGLLYGTPIPFAGTWTTDRLRTVAIELETEDGVLPIGPWEADGRVVTLESCFLDAGLEVISIGRTDVVPRARRGWDESQLHTLMEGLAQAPITRRAWELHLLVLSHSTDEDLLGVMFDQTARLPRQGAAVFADAVRDIDDANAVRRLIQTSVHELGHGLNLVHRFEREVGRRDSSSFMNYEWLYRGGRRTQEYWTQFDFRFDHDELEFLRHAPLPALIPGGSGFRSSRYWTTGSDGYMPYWPETIVSDITLELRSPAGGPFLRFGQPVFLEAVLTNNTGGPIALPSRMLDIKSGFLEILVTRARNGISPDPAEAMRFEPLLNRCCDLSPAAMTTIPAGGSMSNNVSLAYGSGGFAFAEPGAYDVTAVAVMTIPLIASGREEARDVLIRSEPLRIRIAHPQTLEEERDAMLLLDEDVGTFVALGGSAALHRARESIKDLQERRASRGEASDPVAAVLTRAEAFHRAREYTRFSREGFIQEPAEPEVALELLESLDDASLAAFDAFTITQTRRTRERLANELRSKAST